MYSTFLCRCVDGYLCMRESVTCLLVICRCKRKKPSLRNTFALNLCPSRLAHLLSSCYCDLVVGFPCIELSGSGILAGWILYCLLEVNTVDLWIFVWSGSLLGAKVINKTSFHSLWARLVWSLYKTTTKLIDLFFGLLLYDLGGCKVYTYL
ncbi:hypothetical protein BO82DRAFT_3251 [Aspergillus uvarum CBS 121591]|uniref:Uncharacterized protein n=1 Tax=Aspergillus uvarum CBS 121591 TaxID=1448315 RepID=A0A319CR37_9EURO|nr:hypothetical protein BO82DRAFT_3251 [Aspergillus uvarum CBS 121591]PYH87120.1 hypothetical protein BO82DRAFT_3251 [Aspergillus uvarum CBS 121591]